MAPSISQLSEEKDYLRHQLKEKNIEYFFTRFMRSWYLKIVIAVCSFSIVYYKRYEALILVLIPFLVYLYKRQSMKRKMYKLSVEIEEMKRIKYGE